MTGLPPSLQPWQSALAALPLDLQQSVGPWLARLARTIGPLRRHRHANDGPPDGFAGLSRRGPYDRLLITEWALADAAPDEFVRRAAAKEHLFLELARQEPAGGLRSVVLFDAGPSQLGGPRLVHLAALIVLAQRSSDAGAALRFGVLQSPPSALDALSPRSAQQIMHTRFGREPDESDWAGWMTEVAESPDGAVEVDDLWVVGGPTSLALAAGTGSGHIKASDVLEVDGRQVQVDLRRGASHRSLRLDLPSPRACVRALRDPYDITVKKRSTVNVTALSMRFSYDARHLMIRTETGITALRVARYTSEGGGTTRHLEVTDAPVIASDSHKRRYFVLTHTEDQLELRVYNRRGANHRRWRFDVPDDFVLPGADHPLGAMVPLRLRTPQPDRFVIFDALDSAFELNLDREPALRPLPSPLLAVARADDGVTALASTANNPEQVQLLKLGDPNESAVIRRFDAYPPAIAYIGWAGAKSLLAIRLGFDQWAFAERGDVVVAHPSHTVGTTLHSFPSVGQLPALVALPDDRRSLVLIGPGYLTRTRALPFQAVEATCATRFPLVAVRSEDGQLEVIDLNDFEGDTRGQR